MAAATCCTTGLATWYRLAPAGDIGDDSLDCFVAKQIQGIGKIGQGCGTGEILHVEIELPAQNLDLDAKLSSVGILWRGMIGCDPYWAVLSLSIL